MTEEEEGIKTGSSEDDISDDDVENLLAPQDQSEKEEKDLKAAEKPKVKYSICDNVEIFQVEPDRSTESDHPSDSDEFDQFYE
ncbi:Cyclin-dependent kinase-like 5 [Dissostichus eleginoides]|uniref:Cyclin-dependent kinase-like 5 n=1 Tax=Dissostichus eleginoides TaxID=100907 RepID=A0AAD9CN37_DISEL|nr:Cyclin-dependent kinase-like 5 [Dissostichus eleginoides]